MQLPLFSTRHRDHSPIRASLLALSIFAGLASGVVSADAQGIPGYVVLPLVSIPRSNSAMMRVTINERPTMLVLDTGATAIALDRGFYQAAHVRSDNASPGELPPGVGTKFKANGETSAEVGFVDSLKAGGTELGKRRVGVMDLTGLFAQYNNMHGRASIAGLLGEDVLRQYSAIIDWRRRGVYLNLDPSKRLKLGPGLLASGWTAVPMYSTNARHFAVQSTVSGKPVRLLVDTGADLTTFAPDIVPLEMRYNRDTHGSMVRLSSNTGVMGMIGQSAVVNPARVEHWMIGNYEIPSFNVAVSRMVPALLEEQSAGNGPILGLLGSEVLASNNAIIDIAGSTLYLKPGKH